MQSASRPVSQLTLSGTSIREHLIALALGTRLTAVVGSRAVGATQLSERCSAGGCPTYLPIYLPKRR